MNKNIYMKELTQSVFWGQPESVNWCGVDYDGMLSFGEATNPRYTWASERWRGFEKIGETVDSTEYKPLTMLWRKPICIKGISSNLCSSILGKDCPCEVYKKRIANKIEQ